MAGAADFEILKECMRQTRKVFEKKKGIVDKPRADKVASDGAISQSVKRIVWKRDEGKCQWRTADGGICGATHQVEFHHKQDRGKGGLGSPANVILLCTQHNFLAAQVAWGDDFMERFRNLRKTAPEALQSRLEFTRSP